MRRSVELFSVIVALTAAAVATAEQLGATVEARARDAEVPATAADATAQAAALRWDGECDAAAAGGEAGVCALSALQLRAAQNAQGEDTVNASAPYDIFTPGNKMRASQLRVQASCKGSSGEKVLEGAFDMTYLGNGMSGMVFEIPDKRAFVAKFPLSAAKAETLKEDVEAYELARKLAKQPWMREWVPATYDCGQVQVLRATSTSGGKIAMTSEFKFPMIIKAYVNGTELKDVVMTMASGDGNPNGQPPAACKLNDRFSTETFERVMKMEPFQSEGLEQASSDLEEQLRCFLHAAATLINTTDFAWGDVDAANLMWGFNLARPNSPPGLWLVDAMVANYKNKELDKEGAWRKITELPFTTYFFLRHCRGKVGHWKGLPTGTYKTVLQDWCRLKGGA